MNLSSESLSLSLSLSQRLSRIPSLRDGSLSLSGLSQTLSLSLCVCVCVCVVRACSRGRPEREKAMLSRVMYLMIMEAYGLCAFIKLSGTIMVLRLV